MAAATPDLWLKLYQLPGLDDIVKHPDFTDNTQRMKNHEALKRILNEKFSRRTRMQWTQDLIALGLPAGPIFDMTDAFNDPHVIQNRMAEPIEHPTLGTMRTPTNPIRMQALGDRSVHRHAPMLGERSKAILSDYGLTADRIDALIAGGAVRQAG